MRFLSIKNVHQLKNNMHLDRDLRQCIIGHSGHSPLIISACFWLRSLHLILRWSHLATCKGMVSTSWWVASRYILLVSMARHKMMSSNEFKHVQYVLLWGLNKIYWNTWKFTVYSVCGLEWTLLLSVSFCICLCRWYEGMSVNLSYKQRKMKHGFLTPRQTINGTVVFYLEAFCLWKHRLNVAKDLKSKHKL